MRNILGFAIAATLAIGGYIWATQNSATAQPPAEGALGTAMVSVTLPNSLSPDEESGKRAYDANCAACHGQSAAGQDGVAPPLVHIIYEPSHHGDESFQRAVAQGVRAHHWTFGDMPVVEGLTRAEVAMITGYIRALQRANGIN